MITINIELCDQEDAQNFVAVLAYFVNEYDDFVDAIFSEASEVIDADSVTS